MSQLIRYAVTGAGLAVVFTLVYEAVLAVAPQAPQWANAWGFLATTGLGFVVHSRWSFRDHGERNAPVMRAIRFFIINLCSFALNAFWVWLLAVRMGLSPHAPLLPMLGVTPWLSFFFNRRWAFGKG